jgi:hypothetical protein
MDWRCGLLLVLLSPLLLGADAPSSQPAAPLRELFDQLNDARPEARRDALEKLMLISFDELPALRDVVEHARPVTPSQRVALREIVTQVVLAHEPYAPDPEGGGFLGLIWPPLTPFVEDSDPTQGVIVRRRVPGSPSYAQLRDGDVILSAREIAVDPVRFKNSFIELVKPFQAGQTITLQVMRDGKLLVVPIKLKPRPANVGGQQLESWIAARLDIANEYWNNMFRLLVGDDQVS